MSCVEENNFKVIWATPVLYEMLHKGYTEKNVDYKLEPP